MLPLFLMMEENSMHYVIVNREDDTFLSCISLGPSPLISPLNWTDSLTRCLHFSSQEDAQKTIDFIVDVLSWELESSLEVVRTG